jgi:hypothetical protein
VRSCHARAEPGVNTITSDVGNQYASGGDRLAKWLGD